MTRAECKAARERAEAGAMEHELARSDIKALCDMLERAAAIINNSYLSSPGSAVIEERRRWLEEWYR